RPDDLDHLDLLATRSCEDDVEGGLLLLGGPVSTCRGGRGDRDRSGGGDAPLVLDLLLQLDEVENGHLPELLEHLVGRASGHYCSSSFSSESGAGASGSGGVAVVSLVSARASAVWASASAVV